VAVILLAGALLAVLGSGKLAGFGVVVAALVLLGIVGEGYGSGGLTDYGPKREVLAGQAGAERQRRQAQEGPS
jgi:hypothetical protein